MSGRPPRRCKTFAVDERMRVPRPAARIRMSSGGLCGCEGCCCGCLSIESLLACGGRRRTGGARPRLLVTGEDNARQLLGAVPNLLALVQKVCAHDLGLAAELLFEFVVGEPDLVRALGGVRLGLHRADAPVVDDDEVELDLGRVRLDDLDVWRAV